MRKLILLAALTPLVLVGCAGKKDYHYWQKTDTASALYLTGPKAQQILEEDISTCVHEIVELTKLANVRENTPGYTQGIKNIDHLDVAAALKNLPHWETPEYIRDLRVDHSDYHDFDGCMISKGWARVKYVHPSTEHAAKNTYNETYKQSVRPSAKKKYYQKTHTIESSEQEYMEDR